MTSSRDKGNRRERQAAELYERAGYETFRPQESKFGETDIFGLFDILAVPGPETDREGVRLSQVKSNRAEGIEEWRESAIKRFAGADVYVEYLVCYDRQGWRLISPHPTSGRLTFVDERDGHDPCHSLESVGEGEAYDMGEGVVEYLGGDA